MQGLTLRQLHSLQRDVARLADAARPSVEPREAATTGLDRSRSESLSANELRAILRQELQPLRDTQREETTGKKSSAEAEAQLPRNAEAFQRARQVVAEALRVGVWTDRQASEFRTLKGSLTTEQLVSLSSQLFPAVNERRVRVDVNGPPF